MNRRPQKRLTPTIGHSTRARGDGLINDSLEGFGSGFVAFFIPSIRQFICNVAKKNNAFPTAW